MIRIPWHVCTKNINIFTFLHHAMLKLTDKDHNEMLACMHPYLATDKSRNLLGTGSNSLPPTHLFSHTHIPAQPKAASNAFKYVYYWLKLFKNYNKIAILPQRHFKIGMYYFSAVMDSQNKYIHRIISIPYAPVWWTHFMLLCNADKHFISLSQFFSLCS